MSCGSSQQIEKVKDCNNDVSGKWIVYYIQKPFRRLPSKDKKDDYQKYTIIDNKIISSNSTMNYYKENNCNIYSYINGKKISISLTSMDSMVWVQRILPQESLVIRLKRNDN